MITPQHLDVALNWALVLWCGYQLGKLRGDDNGYARGYKMGRCLGRIEGALEMMKENDAMKKQEHKL